VGLLERGVRRLQLAEEDLLEHAEP
jgi:hypothetical protein